MNLRETQALFWRAIQWPTGVEDFLAQSDERTRAEFETTFVSTGEFDRVARMNVYAEAYFWRLFDVLQDGYAATAFTMGEVDFRNLITDYVLAHPPSNAALRHLGDRVVDFVAAHEVCERRPWLAELARLEHGRAIVLDLADEPAMSTAQLAEIPIHEWPRLRFCLANTAKVLTSAYDVHHCYMEWKTEAAAPTPPAGGAGQFYGQLVWRKGFAVVHRPLPNAERAALCALERGETFEEISAHADASLEGHENAAQVVGWLRGWLEAGILAGTISEE